MRELTVNEKQEVNGALLANAAGALGGAVGGIVGVRASGGSWGGAIAAGIGGAAVGFIFPVRGAYAGANAFASGFGASGSRVFVATFTSSSLANSSR